MKNQKKKTSVVPLKKKVVLDLNQYHNSETGELLSSEKSTLPSPGDWQLGVSHARTYRKH